MSRRGQLGSHALPGSLIDVSAVGRWCPGCFVDGRPIADLEHLATYLAILWRDSTLVSRDENARALVGASPYLRSLFPQVVSSRR